MTNSGLTHSFTVLPMLYYGGRLGEKLFVVLAEQNGQLPAGIFTSPNLVVKANRSHIMTKKLLEVLLFYMLVAFLPFTVFCEL